MSRDTSPEIEARYRKLIMARTPQARVAMCFEISADARQIVRRGLLDRGLTGPDLRRAFIDRLYGADLAPEELSRCFEKLERRTG